MTGDEYREVRRDLGLTQAELAKQLGVAPNTVSRRELGRRPITTEAALALCRLAAARSGTTGMGGSSREAAGEKNGNGAT
jgi:transcriptional regulator with XRE-family HTH domain